MYLYLNYSASCHFELGKNYSLIIKYFESYQMNVIENGSNHLTGYILYAVVKIIAVRISRILTRSHQMAF